MFTILFIPLLEYFLSNSLDANVHYFEFLEKAYEGKVITNILVRNAD